LLVGQRCRQSNSQHFYIGAQLNLTRFGGAAGNAQGKPAH
jgi:hypothetical protein